MKNPKSGHNGINSVNGFRSLCSWAMTLFAAVLFAGCSSNTAPEMTSTAESSKDQASMGASTGTNSEAVNEVAVKIDTMMCVEGCFNGIKTVLEKRTGIEEVRLAPQKEEGTIDNSMIFIKHRGELDTAEMERLILGAGFDKIEFVK